MSYFKQVQIDTNNPTGDAFGRVRISQPETIFDSKMDRSNQPLFWDDQEVSGGSTSSTWNGDRASVTLGVTLNTAGRRVRQTFQSFNYQPGKSQVIEMTAVLDKSGGGTDITRRLGQFDDNNGIFFEDAAGTYNVVIRSNVTGSPVENRVAQASWNIDPLDGTGPSGITVDFTNAHIFIIDYQWLGVGRVRMGLDIDGVVVPIHEFNHANLIASVYMSTPNLPLREEIINGGTGAASELEVICAAVISEGGTQDKGIVRSASTDGTPTTAASAGTIYAVIGMRLKAAHLNAVVKLLKSSLQIQTDNESLEWMLLWNPTVAGTFTYADETDSAVQIARGVAANTVTGGHRLEGDFLESGGATSGTGSAGKEVDTSLRLGAAIDATLDELVLCVRPNNGAANVQVEGLLTWRELD